MEDFSTLNFFQFDNLVKNRVPFLLVNLGVNLEGWYKSVYAMHLEAVTVHCETQDALKEIESRNLPPHYAIVILCQDGKKSAELVTQLETKNFTNAFSIRGGFLQMEKERSESL